MDLPLSMEWVPLYAASMNRALLEEVYSWNAEAQVDPLKWVIHLRLVRPWNREEIPLVREVLKEWTKANDCVYRKSVWKGRDFRALIVLKGLGPRQNINPYLVDDDHRGDG